MAPAYKLTYFNVRGAGEFIRFLFAYGDLEFEDNRVEHADWDKIKASTPFGQLPLLEHKGKQINQSIAIARYVAKQVNLTGKTDWENLEIDAIIDTLNDLRSKFPALRAEPDETKRNALLEAFLKDTFAFYMERCEKLASKNGGYLAVGRLTWADVAFAAWIEGVEIRYKRSVLDNYPTLKALKEKVLNTPGIKKWRETRPQSEF